MNRSATFLAAVAAILWGGAAGALAEQAPQAGGRLGPATLKRVERAFDAAFAEGGSFARVGAVVAVVDHGRVALLKGYGHEDLAGRRPVDPQSSRFMVASISKTFVATRIAQLVREGRIASVDTPANRLLKSFQLPRNRGRDITLRQLLTHQAGFADADLPMVIDKGRRADATAVGGAFPGYVRPAGSGAVYSNYGLAVAAAIVEDQTGEPLAESVAEGIWRPLGMDSAQWSAPRAGPGATETAAFYPDGSRVALPYGVVDNPVVAHGAGGASASAADMARYMIALLGDGPPAAAKAITPVDRQILFTPLGITAAHAQAYGAAFMINDWNGVRLVEHGGRSLGRISYLTLAPDRRLGVFVSVTAEAGAPGPADLAAGVLGGAARMRPGQDARPAPGLFAIRALALRSLFGELRAPAGWRPAGRVDPEAYVGAYRSERRSLPAPTYLLDVALRGAVATVARDGAGLSINGRKGYRPIGPDAFWRAPDGERGPGYSNLAVFRRGPDGRIADMTFGYTDTVYTPLRGLDAPSRFGPLLMVGWLGGLSGLLALIWPRPWGWRALGLLTFAMSLALPVVFFASWPPGAPAPFNIVLADRSAFLAYRLLGTALALAGLLWPFGAFLLARRRGTGIRVWFRRIHLAVLALAGPALAGGLVVGQATLWP